MKCIGFLKYPRLRSVFGSGLYNSTLWFWKKILIKSAGEDKYIGNNMVWVINIPHSSVSWACPLLVPVFGEIMESLCRARLDSICQDERVTKDYICFLSSLALLLLLFHCVRRTRTHVYCHVLSQVFPWWDRRQSSSLVYVDSVRCSSWNDTPNLKNTVMIQLHSEVSIESNNMGNIRI